MAQLQVENMLDKFVSTDTTSAIDEEEQIRIDNFKKRVNEKRHTETFKKKMPPMGYSNSIRIRDVIDLQLRKSRQFDEAYTTGAKDLSPALTWGDSIFGANQSYILGRFSNNGVEDYEAAKVVVNSFGSKMTQKLNYELQNVYYKSYDKINKQSFIREMIFDGYDSGTTKEGDYAYRSFTKEHYWFNLGLAMGESQVVNPPFQFHENDDARTHSRYIKLGRIYAESIYGDMTIGSFMPGTIIYHTGLFRMINLDGGATAASAAYIRSGGSGIRGIISSAWTSATDALSIFGAVGALVFGNGRIAEFKERPNLFKRYVNGLLETVSTNLGLTSWFGDYVGKHKAIGLDHILPGVSLSLSNKGLWGMGERSNSIINFRIGNDIGVTESFSNSTTTNPIADALNAESTAETADAQSGNMGKVKSSMNGIAQILAGNTMSGAMQIASSWGKKIAGLGSEMMFLKAGGGKISLPEIYESSSFSRSYSFNFVFHSPYGDLQSIFENCYVPAIILFAMSLPRQVGGFTYIEPFALKVVVPGLLNINFGIVESLSVERGEQINDWTENRIPKTIKMTVGIKDMDHVVTMPLASRSLVKNLFPNLFPASGIAEYFSTMSGLSLLDQLDFRKQLGRNFKRWASGWKNRLDYDTIRSTLYNTGIGRLIGVFTGVIGTDDIRGNEENLDKVNEHFVRDGRLVNQGNSITTRIHRWLAKIVVNTFQGQSATDSEGEVDYEKYTETYLAADKFYGTDETEQGIDTSTWSSLNIKTTDNTEENN